MKAMKGVLVSSALVIGLMLTHHAFLVRESAAVFNEEALKARFITQLASQGLPQELIAQKTQSFKKALSASLNEYRDSHQHQLVLNQAAVTFGATDITETIAAAVAKKMKAKSA